VLLNNNPGADLIDNFSLKPENNPCYGRQRMKKFSLTALFFVTGICFFIFSKAIWFIDGTRLPLLPGSVYCYSFGSLNLIRGMLQRQRIKEDPVFNSCLTWSNTTCPSMVDAMILFLSITLTGIHHGVIIL